VGAVPARIGTSVAPGQPRTRPPAPVQIGGSEETSVSNPRDAGPGLPSRFVFLSKKHRAGWTVSDVPSVMRKPTAVKKGPTTYGPSTRLEVLQNSPRRLTLTGTSYNLRQTDQGRAGHRGQSSAFGGRARLGASTVRQKEDKEWGHRGAQHHATSAFGRTIEVPDDNLLGRGEPRFQASPIGADAGGTAPKPRPPAVVPAMVPSRPTSRRLPAFISDFRATRYSKERVTVSRRVPDRDANQA